MRKLAESLIQANHSLAAVGVRSSRHRLASPAAPHLPLAIP